MGKKIPRCPKCRALPARYREHMTAEMRRYEADAEGRPAKRMGAIDPMPDILVAICPIGHEWCPRGARSVRDLL